MCEALPPTCEKQIQEHWGQEHGLQALALKAHIHRVIEKGGYL